MFSSTHGLAQNSLAVSLHTHTHTHTHQHCNNKQPCLKLCTQTQNMNFASTEYRT